MIRTATIYDIDGIASLLHQVAASMPGGSKADVDHWRREAATCVHSEEAISLVAEHDGEIIGFISGRIIYEPTSHEHVCLEHPWVSHPDRRSCGNDLRREAERIAKSRGASKMLIHCPDDRIEKIISRSGYKKAYTIYERAI